MTRTEMFESFIGNLAVDNADSIKTKYEQITSSLNKKFRNSESKEKNSLRVGSYGRHTGIKGISDLDMLYIMPKSKWVEYKDNKQSKLLDDTVSAIKERYPRTEIKKDRLVVQVLYKNFMVEVQPVFEQDDGSFKYPDTYKGGKWKITKPKLEIQAMKEFMEQKNKNLRKLCKMTRAWKNKCGLGMGGLLIDTLAYNFLKSTTDYDNRSTAFYGLMCKDFFQYLSELDPKQEYYLALGSEQRVYVKAKFQTKAKEAYEKCLEAMSKNDAKKESDIWRKIFGRLFPNVVEQENRSQFLDYKNTEEFIENYHPVDIKYSLIIDCKITQNGFRDQLLRHLIRNKLPLRAKKNLKFYVDKINVPEKYTLKWKVLNRGTEAQKRNCIRGNVFSDSGSNSIKEYSSFYGEHIVECYAIKNNVVVARDKIIVPIS